MLIKQDNGLYRYESRRKEVVLDEEAPARIAAAGNNVSLDTGTPGNFAYVVRRCRQGTGSTASSTAWRATPTSRRSLDRNAELQLALDRKDYEPGQEIEVSIRAPYVGAGLITIERDKVYAHALVQDRQDRLGAEDRAAQGLRGARATSTCTSCATRPRTRST